MISQGLKLAGAGIGAQGSLALSCSSTINDKFAKIRWGSSGV